MCPNESRFWQYKVYADIRGIPWGSLERGPMASSIFRAFGRYVFGTLGRLDGTTVRALDQGRRVYIFKVFIEYPLNLGSGCISV